MELRVVVGGGQSAPAGPVSAPRPTPGRQAPGGPASPAHEASDAVCVALARAREPGAFEELYRRHARYALALAVRVQGHSRDVEDVVHDAFLRAHDRLDQLRSDDSFRGWLGSMVVSLVRSRMRSARLLSLLGLGGSDELELDSLVGCEASPEARAEVAEVYTALQRLPLEERIVWTLRFVQGHKLEEVADLAGCSLATAKRRLLRAQEGLSLLGLGGGRLPERNEPERNEPERNEPERNERADAAGEPS